MPFKCDIEIPENVLKSLGLRESEVSSVIKKELAAFFFQRGVLSFGQARQFAEMSIWDFIEFLKERKIPLHYDLSEYEEDLKTIEEIA
jgi:predicted HTH domain antitoxin